MRIEDSWLALSTAEVSFDVYLLRCLLTAVYENIKKKKKRFRNRNALFATKTYCLINIDFDKIRLSQAESTKNVVLYGNLRL